MLCRGEVLLREKKNKRVKHKFGLEAAIEVFLRLSTAASGQQRGI